MKRLHIFQDAFLVQPARDDPSDAPTLRIDRATGALTRVLVPADAAAAAAPASAAAAAGAAAAGGAAAPDLTQAFSLAIYGIVGIAKSVRGGSCDGARMLLSSFVCAWSVIWALPLRVDVASACTHTVLGRALLTPGAFAQAAARPLSRGHHRQRECWLAVRRGRAEGAHIRALLSRAPLVDRNCTAASSRAQVTETAIFPFSANREQVGLCVWRCARCSCVRAVCRPPGGPALCRRARR